MKNIKIHTYIFSLMIFAIFCSIACDSSDYSVPPSFNTSENQNSAISVKLTDAPGDNDEVNLEVIYVLIKTTDIGNVILPLTN